MNRIILTSLSLYKLLNIIKNTFKYGTSRTRFRRIDKIRNGVYILTIHTTEGRGNILLDLKNNLISYGVLKIKESQVDQITDFLNKKMKNALITEFYQYKFDRIIVLTLQSNDVIHIIIELFGAGNLIITDENYVIISAFKEFETKNRVIKRGNPYTFPQDRLELIYRYIEEHGYINKKTVFRYSPLDPISTKVLLSSDKDTYQKQEIEKMIEKIHRISQQILNDECFYLIKEGDKTYIQPFQIHRDDEKICGLEKITSFLNQKILEKDVDNTVELLEKEIQRLRETVSSILEEKKNAINMLNTLYIYIEELNSAFQRIQNGENVEKIGDYVVKDINRKDKTVKIEKNGISIKLRYDLNPYASISYAYDKIKSLDDAVENLRKKIAQLEEKIKIEKAKQREETVKIRKRLRTHWFEKYIWSISTNGYLIVAGKDATTNEVLIKKYMEDEDLVFHSEIQGSPFTLLKEGKKADDDDIRDAALITASYSKAWKLGISSIPVYYVNPDQVTKKTPSGLYIKKGSFMIYGKKNYVKDIHIQLYVGVTLIENTPKILVASKKSILKNTIPEENTYIKLYQGKKSKSEIAKKIVKKFIEDGLIDAELEEEYLQDIMNRLPSGYYQLEYINRGVLEKT